MILGVAGSSPVSHPLVSPAIPPKPLPIAVLTNAFVAPEDRSAVLLTVEDARRGFRTMVDFLGIGVQKGGTTWLFHQLSRHPQVAFPAGKEVHFWDRVAADQVARWIAMLQPPSRTDAAGRPVRTGEITPSYAALPPETIRAIREACPGIRLFITFRNPLERAWSAALMAMVRG